MSDTWTHSVLGAFRKSSMNWTRTISNLWLDVFDYGCRNGQHKIELSIQHNQEETEPETEAIQELQDFWGRCDHLATVMLDALWIDIAGSTPSEMWWSGIVQRKWEGDVFFEDESIPIPFSEETLRHHLSVISIHAKFIPPETGATSIVNPFTGEKMLKTRVVPARDGFWAVFVTFDSNFEHEHGIGVIVRRGEVIGIGYGYGDAEPFASYKP